MKIRFIFYLLLVLQTSFASTQVDSTIIKKVDILFDDYLDLLYDSPDSALHILKSIETLSINTNYESGIALVLREKGMYYSQRGDFVTAMEWMDSALHIDEKIGNMDGVASDLLFLGLNFLDQEKSKEALDYLPRARDIYTEMNDSAGIALINSNLGMIYRNLNQFKKALECYDLARQYYLEHNYETNLASVENNIGNLYKDLKQYELALEYLFRSKELKIKHNMSFSLVPTLSNIADIYQEQDRIEEAIDYYEQALKIAVEQHARAFLKDIFLDLSRAYESAGDEMEALSYFKKYNNLKDSLLSDDYNNDLADMKIKYETEKKEKENLLLLKENELQEANIQKEKNRKILFAVLSAFVFLGAFFFFILFRNKKKMNEELEKINTQVKKQNSTLKTLNKELIDSEENLTKSNQSKDLLISMLSHDLYNPVTAIVNYTRQISETSKEMSNSDLARSFSKVTNAAIPLKDLLDNILQWAQLQNDHREITYEKLNLEQEISKIVDLYQPVATLNEIELKKQLGEGIIQTDKMMLHFIVRNILQNAIKFSPYKTTIIIELKVTDLLWTITVSDEGKGFDEVILPALNSPIINNNITTDGSGIGLSISRNFVQQLKGSIHFSNKNTGGASVEIKIPVS